MVYFHIGNVPLLTSFVITLVLIIYLIDSLG